MNPPPASPQSSVDHAPADLDRPRAAARDRAQLDALLGLLGDESPTVWSQVRQELERQGPAVARDLRRVARAGEPRARMRARRMLLAFERDRLALRLVRFCCRPKIDLEAGLWLLSRFEEPRLDVRPYVLALDAMAAEVLRRTESMPPGHGRSLALIDYLARELGFTGDAADYHHPENVYLHRAIVRKRGLPLTLAAIYLLVARRAGIDGGLLPLPGRVMLRLAAPDKDLIVDPFDGGAVRTQRELLGYLAKHKKPFDPTWFANADEGAMFLRQTLNLRVSYQRRGLQREARTVERVLEALCRAREIPAIG